MAVQHQPGRIAFIADYLPRQCGIATFTADLLEAVAKEVPKADIFAVAMNDVADGYRYPERVKFEILQNDRPGYRKAADFLNISHVDVALMQHEYGIYGGEAGSHILTLLRELRMPVITTLHTVLQAPNDSQKAVLEEIADISARLVVMSSRAVGFLKNVYGVPQEKIELIHHGVPDVPFVDPNYYKDLFGVEGRRMILNFGLLSPGKGVEYMIQAMPRIVRKFPDTVFIVLGATHPHIIRTKGEEYRLFLQRLARELNVADNVVFHNRFVETEELCEFIGAADVYVTPYLNPEQITSGTLAYAVGAGKAVVSTPYWYAEELLADGRGVLAPFKDPDALADGIVGLFSNEVERHAMRKRAYTFGRQMIWREVARRYIEVFFDIYKSLSQKPMGLPIARKKADIMELPPLKLDHLKWLTDDTGMIQHAVFTTPNYHEGYCTDDNSRAVMVAVTAAEETGEDEVLYPLANRYIAFLQYAFNREIRRFRNFLSFDRNWLEEVGSEDAHGRALWGLGSTVAHCEMDGLRGLSANLFELALPAVEGFTSPRAWAFTLVGIHEFLRRFGGATEVRRVREILAEKLFSLWRDNSSQDWPWFEENLAYANATLPHAMILSGQWMRRPDMFDCGIRSLSWLCGVQTLQGYFAPVGSNGFYTRGGDIARFDQQPVEAASTIRACFEAYRSTGDERWTVEARRAFEWFLGANVLNQPLYDPATGGCRDGLHPDRVNQNEGAEATLSWLVSLLEMQSGARARKERTE
ncbi:MAG: glycosyltransferase family 4 protein [Planctomycetes bacterium]|nr:glycosyltransferase family 4 protein [Planctomycetota bacterium]